MKEATCSKCGDIYNPEEFGDVHFANDCNGKPVKEIQYGTEPVKDWRDEHLQRLQQSEEKAYLQRNEVEDLITKLIGKQKDNSFFFTLRQAFSQYEDAEERCVKATDRLIEYRSNIEL